MSSENVEEFVEVTNKIEILGREYETSGSASATATGDNKKQIALNIAKFLATIQCNSVGLCTKLGYSQSKNGYYPLYLSESLAIQNSNTDPPSAHSHLINGTIWFMPNKINNEGLFHGDSSNGLQPFIVPNFPSLLSQILIETDELSLLTSTIQSLSLLEFFQNTFEPVDNPTTWKNYTLLAPLNSAFEQKEIVEILPTLSNDELTNILLNHVIETDVLSSQLQDGQIIKTLGSLELEVSIDTESSKVYFVSPGSTAEVIYADILAINGIIHVINKVLLPNITPGTPGTPVEPDPDVTSY